MSKIKSVLITIIIFICAIALFPAGADSAEKVLYVGGSMALTGAYAQDTKAVLAAFEDYVKYVNETKKLAPWRKEKFPADIKLEVLWRDDELQPPKTISIYEELKGKGILVFRCAGSPQALALKDKLFADQMGATSMATTPALLKPPQSVFTWYPIYTDSLAAAADWFKANWKEKRKPRVAYLTSNNPMGKSIEIPEMKAYLEKIGYEYVGAQYIELVPSAPPTTQLMWLKENKVDLAVGVLINPNAQPTVKEMVRLGMGPHLAYKITLAAATPSHMPVFTPAMGKLGDGYVVAGGLPPFYETTAPGIKFLNELQSKKPEDKRVTHILYVGGILEAMTQVEALRLALTKVPFEKLTPKAVLENGFYMIKNLDTGALSSSPLNYGKGKVEGVDKVRVDQQLDGKIVKLGTWPVRHIYEHQ